MCVSVCQEVVIKPDYNVAIGALALGSPTDIYKHVPAFMLHTFINSHTTS